MVNLLSGLLFLIAGRKLFWVFVGIVGFLLGMHFALEYFAPHGQATALLFSLIIGALGAFLALGFEWVAIFLSGFLGGGYFLMNIFSYGGGSPESAIFIFLIGGLCGLLLTILLFDWALILLTSLVGAVLISKHLTVNEPAQMITFIICAVIGIIVQAYFLSESQKEEDEED